MVSNNAAPVVIADMEDLLSQNPGVRLDDDHA